MKGILSYGSYIPQWRLARSEIPKMVGNGGGSGTRSVASFDEDTTTLGYEAARLALHAAPSDISPSALWFTTVTPAYTDKANATAIHAALRLSPDVMAADLSGSVRSSIGALCLALQADAPSIVVTADLRSGLPGSSDESEGGDAGAALLVGEGPVIAELVAIASSTAEFTERWRTPGEVNSHVWEDRFGETRYVPFDQSRPWLSGWESRVAWSTIWEPLSGGRVRPLPHCYWEPASIKLPLTKPSPLCPWPMEPMCSSFALHQPSPHLRPLGPRILKQLPANRCHMANISHGAASSPYSHRTGLSRPGFLRLLPLALSTGSSL
jgi:hypothetical protein